MRIYRVAATPPVPVAASTLATDRPSIAVLPFDNLSGDPTEQYFSDGITEDIITELSRFRSLFVIARNSSFQFRGAATDVRRIGHELRVQYVVEGSVRKAGDRLRITVQLIDSMTGNHVWSDRYDRALVDVFAVQDEVVHAIVAMLAGQLSIAETEKSRRKRTTHLGAHDCYLRGLEYWRSPGPDADAKSNTWFERALALDPDYVEPLTRLCISEALLAGYSESDNRWDRPLAMATKAVVLDPNNSWSHCALGFVKFSSGRLAEAGPDFDTAMRLNPNDPDQIMWCSNYHTYSGYFEVARNMIAEAERLNPLPPSWYGKGKAVVEYGLRHYATACRLFEGMGNGLHYWEHCYLAACYVRLGKPPNAEREVAEALRLKPNLCIRELALVEPYARQDDLNHLLAPVRMAGLPD
jgi:TolB-like protein